VLVADNVSDPEEVELFLMVRDWVEYMMGVGRWIKYVGMIGLDPSPVQLCVLSFRYIW
jgi:hypothetical protein